MWKFCLQKPETIEYVKSLPTFKEIYKPHREINRKFLGLRMRDFQGIVFIRTQICREIFTSAIKSF